MGFGAVIGCHWDNRSENASARQMLRGSVDAVFSTRVAKLPGNPRNRGTVWRGTRRAAVDRVAIEQAR